MAVISTSVKKSLTFLLLYAAVSVHSQSNVTTSEAPSTTTQSPTDDPTTVPENTDLGICTCDLTGNSCDVNCCCDPDCTTDDQTAFSTCNDQYTASDNQACVRSSIVFRENTPYTVEETSGGLFCVLTDNYEERNYYNVPDTVTTSTQFEEYVAKYGDTSFKRGSTSAELPTTFYKSGDALLTVYSTGAVGRLGLPRALTSQACADTNPAAFLYDQTSLCVREIADIAAACELLPALNAKTYFEYFRIIPNPALLSETFGDNSGDTSTTEPSSGTTDTVTQPTTSGTTSGNVASMTLYDNALNITVDDPLICMDSDGFNTTCTFTDIPSPTYDGTTCANVAIRVEYVITHNGTNGVTDAKIRLIFANITAENLPLNQAFVSSFVKEGDENTTERSGNPGYMVGQPLLAGNLVTVTDVNGVEKNVIEMDVNRNNRFTIVTSSAAGDCITEPTNRIPVTFGEDMRSGCKLRVRFDNMTRSCQLLSDAAVAALEGSSVATHVATFGDTTVEEVGDWLTIINGDLSGTGSTGTGFCTSVVLGMHIEVLYANVGALGNPQAKIIGVKKTFQQHDIYFQCIGPYCQPSTENLAQAFEVTSSVGFVDASDPAVDVDAEYPQFSARLPEDFFYPFT